MRKLLPVLLLAAMPAFAQTVPPAAPEAHARAVAAGYKALTLCSAHLGGGRDPAQVDAVELRGI